MGDQKIKFEVILMELLCFFVLLNGGFSHFHFVSFSYPQDLVQVVCTLERCFHLEFLWRFSVPH